MRADGTRGLRVRNKVSGVGSGQYQHHQKRVSLFFVAGRNFALSLETHRVCDDVEVKKFTGDSSGGRDAGRPRLGRNSHRTKVTDITSDDM